LSWAEAMGHEVLAYHRSQQASTGPKSAVEAA